MSLPPYPVGGVQSTSVPLFPFSSTRAHWEIDLRKEMKIMLEGNAEWPRRGHWVVLRRMDQKQRCNCWNEIKPGPGGLIDDKRKYDEPKLRCPICRGEGWIYHEETHLVRRRLVAPEIGLAAEKTLSDVGFMSINYLVFYFQYYVNPGIQDVLIEVELDSQGNPVRPFNYKERYSIAVAEPFRDINGRIEYWRAACKLEIV